MMGPEQVTSAPDGRSLFTVFANGILAEPGDEEGLAAALVRLLSDARARARMGQEGRRFVREQFSKDRLVADMRALYERCLHGQGCASSETVRGLDWEAGRASPSKKVKA
jgi:glycosyltransferase involved in cell wall biosynthesis